MQQPGQNSREMRPDVQEHTQLTAGGSPVAGEFKVGDIIGGSYRVQKWIGAGGMGNVYRVEHTMMQSEYALKTLSADKVTEVAWRRFQNEAQAIARMNHPNVVSIYNLDLHEARLPFYVMDLLQGDTMLDYLRINGPMPIEKALELFIEICSGLGYAHKKGIVHRDVKPPNIVLLDNPEANCKLKIVDFGIAKLSGVKDPQNQYLTNVGEVCGSPYYMSPEQTEGKRIDARSDIYSLGCTLFEMLTGTPPFRGQSAVDTMIMHQTAVPPTLKTASGGKEFPEMLERAVATMLAKEPMDRYQTMERVMQDLVLIKGGQQGALSPFSTQSQTALNLKDQNERNNRQTGRQTGLNSTSSYARQGESAGDYNARGQRNSQNQAEEDSEEGESSSPYGKLIAWAVALIILAAGIGAGFWWQSQHQPRQPKTIATRVVDKPATGLSVTDADLGVTFMASQAAPNDPIDPDYVPEKPKNSMNDKQFFSSKKIENGKPYRLFEFPRDFSMGRIKTEKGDEKEATETLRFPLYGALCLTPSVVLADYPQYMKRFRPYEIGTITLDEGPTYSVFEKLLQQAAQVPGLNKLQLNDCTHLTDRGLDAINSIENLEYLGVNSRAFDAKTLAKIKKIPDLLGIGCKSSLDADPLLKLLKDNGHVQVLDLTRSSLSHQGFSDLATMKNLQDLALGDMKLDDEDFKILSGCKSLRILSTERTKLTAQKLLYLQRMRLRNLTVLESDITPLTKKDLESKLPGVHVDVGGQIGEQASMALH
ncbi:MAG: protein kinase [Cyanobacteria bacterium REEB67]|nr:protein kinase [Cyanobacteria bacterium REEB67]